MSKGKNYRFTPFWMAISAVVGILIGSFYANHFSGNRLSIINTSGNKLTNLLHIIDDQYVDTVNINDLVEKAMPQILSELDPHSVYITAREGEIANDDLRGSFSGIGIGGEGYTTFTIAGPTGEGLTSAKSFARSRRCVLVKGLNVR